MSTRLMYVLVGLLLLIIACQVVSITLQILTLKARGIL